MPEQNRLKRWWDNEPAGVAGGLIALVAVIKAVLRWAGIDVPAEVDTSVQVAIAAWVGLFLRAKVAPVDGPDNATVRAAVTVREAQERREAGSE